MVRAWYIVICAFPMIAAMGCWLTVVLPNAGIAFQVVYETWEALALTRFTFVVLTMLHGGVETLDGYIAAKHPERLDAGNDAGLSHHPACVIVGAPLDLFYPELRDDSDGTMLRSAAEKGEPKRAARLFLALYQFVVLGPLCAFMQALCTYAGSSDGSSSSSHWAETTSKLFELLKLVSTVAAVLSLVCTLCSVFHFLPPASRVHLKFVSIKGMVVLGTLQATIVAVIVQCTGSHTVIPPAVAASVWQSLIFLVQLPFLQLAVSSAFPPSDLPALFDFPALGAAPTGEGGAQSDSERRRTADPGSQGCLQVDQRALLKSVDIY